MKLLQFLTLSAVISLAVACSGGTSSTANTTSDSTTKVDPTTITYNGQIAFIRMDSLMRNYGMYIDMSAEFGTKQQKIQNELTSKGRSLEREAMEYQEKAQKGLITTYQARITEEGLQKKQQDIMAYRERVLSELGQEESVMSANISRTIADYLQEFNAQEGYSMIIQTAAGNPILVADPNLDITAEVLAELNKRYEATLSSNAAKK